MRDLALIWLLVLSPARPLENRKRQDGGDVPDLTPPNGCSDQCVSFIDAINRCRDQERQGHGEPLCGCNLDVVNELVNCENCVLNTDTSHVSSDLASAFQQRLNDYVSRCNAFIDSTSSSLGADPNVTLFSTSISFSQGVNTSSITITTTSSPTEGTIFPADVFPGFSLDPTSSLTTNSSTSPTSDTRGSTGSPTQDSNTDSSRRGTGAIIGGVVGGCSALALIVIVIWVFLRRKRREVGKKKRDDSTDVVPYDLTEPTGQDRTLGIDEKGFRRNSGTNGIPDDRPEGRFDQDIEGRGDGPRHGEDENGNTTHAASTTTIPRSMVTTSLPGNLTSRQALIRDDAEELRTQIKSLQQAMVTSNEGVQDLRAATASMMAQIQRLEEQIDSDWARGLSDEPPPEYATFR